MLILIIVLLIMLTLFLGIWIGGIWMIRIAKKEAREGLLSFCNEYYRTEKVTKKVTTTDS